MNQIILVGKIDSIDYENFILLLEVKDKINGETDIIPVSVRKEMIDLLGSNNDVIGIKGKIKMASDNITIVLEKVTLISNTKTLSD